MGREILSRQAPEADERIPYGDDANQFVEFRWSRLPGTRPLVVNIHGGFWRARYDLSHAGNLCHALTRAGVHTANVEYRRVGQSGGGWPGTAQDVLAGVRFAIARAGTPAIVTGHSAGGHLALWLASELPELLGVIALGPVAHLCLAAQRKLGDGAVHDFLGGTPDEARDCYAAADPAGRPSPVPRLLIHGTLDDVVPVEISRAYTESRAGDPNPPRLLELSGADHFDIIDPESRFWPEVESAVLSEPRRSGSGAQ